VKIADWGNYPTVDATVKSFSNTKNLRKVLSEFQNSITRGLGRCYGDSALWQNIISSLKLNRMLEFKEYAGINAFPITVHTQNSFEIINVVKNISPAFAGVNLEDISAPRCFEIEEALQDIGIPVFHDDQHGTAIVLLAALINAAKVAGKDMRSLKVVISGAGAAGTAIAQLLLCVGHDPKVCEPVREIIVCDSKGILSKKRTDISENPWKRRLATITNRNDLEGSLKEAMARKATRTRRRNISTCLKS